MQTPRVDGETPARAGDGDAQVEKEIASHKEGDHPALPAARQSRREGRGAKRCGWHVGTVRGHRRHPGHMEKGRHECCCKMGDAFSSLHLDVLAARVW